MIDLKHQGQNYLLATLPVSEHRYLSSQLELVHMPPGKVLCEPGGVLSHVYFPTTSVVSILHITQEGSCAETAVVGNEGMIGVSLFMGGESGISKAVVQSPGYAYRLKKQVLKQEFDRSSSVRQVLLRYTQALIAQVAQTAACNRHHSVDQQLCRWLLLNLDRSLSNDLTMTHEAIANRLGVRREGITDAAGKLRSAGAIHYNRGHITVLDRSRLEDRSCECYAVVKNEFDRLLPEMVAV